MQIRRSHIPCRPRFTISGLFTARRSRRGGGARTAPPATKRAARSAALKPEAPGFLFPAGRETGKRWGKHRRLNAAEKKQAPISPRARRNAHYLRGRGARGHTISYGGLQPRARTDPHPGRRRWRAYICAPPEAALAPLGAYLKLTLFPTGLTPKGGWPGGKAHNGGGDQFDALWWGRQARPTPFGGQRRANAGKTPAP